MHPDADFDVACQLPPQAAELSQDLGLDILCGSMAKDDRLIFDLSKRALLSGLTNPPAISYRQQILRDCLGNPQVVNLLYEIAADAVEAERKVWGLYSGSPQSILSRGLEATRTLLGYLRQLRQVGDEHASSFSSPGFRRFFQMTSDELDDGYLATVEDQLDRLRFRRGVLLSAKLAEGLTAGQIVLRSPRAQGLIQRLNVLGRSGFSFEVPVRDDGGLRVLDNLRARGINCVANALAQSAEHIRGFFTMLRNELAFYVGCTNLYEQLSEMGLPSCFPEALPASKTALSARGVYDVCLVLRNGGRAVGNDVEAGGKLLLMMTGANQGGKSTLLRALGLAQLMLQSGMFVPALSFRANVCGGVFTHFKREEDATMTSGKFDEELRRMSEIFDQIRPTCLLLCNESFASTNEREGSEVALEVVRAMTDAQVKVVFVTHLFELARRLWTERSRACLFLRAERLADGTRTFRLVEGEPLPTSYGEDAYWQVFGPVPAALSGPPRAGPRRLNESRVRS